MKDPVFMECQAENSNEVSPLRRIGTRRSTDDLKVCILDESGISIPLDLFDLSPTGAYIKSDLLFSPGEKLNLELNLPYLDKPLVLEAVVTRGELFQPERGPGMGVAFDSLRLKDKLILEKCVKMREVKEGNNKT